MKMDWFLKSISSNPNSFYSNYRDYHQRRKWPKSTLASFWNWRFWRVEFANDSGFYRLHGYSQKEICYIKRARSWRPGNYLIYLFWNYSRFIWRRPYFLTYSLTILVLCQCRPDQTIGLIISIKHFKSLSIK